MGPEGFRSRLLCIEFQAVTSVTCIMLVTVLRMPRGSDFVCLAQLPHGSRR